MVSLDLILQFEFSRHLLRTISVYHLVLGIVKTSELFKIRFLSSRDFSDWEAQVENLGGSGHPGHSRHLKVVVGIGRDYASPGLAFPRAGAAQELTDSAAR